MTDTKKPVGSTNATDLSDDGPELVDVADEADLDDETDPVARDDDDEDVGDDDEEDDRPAGDDELFRQSEIAADYIEGLLDILDVDGDIDELVQIGPPMVEVVLA